jgi:hypothetical protein
MTTSTYSRYPLHLPQFSLTMADAPAVKPWGIDDKKKLQQLINDGKVDISRTEDIDYIDSARFKYYRERDNGQLPPQLSELRSLRRHRGALPRILRSSRSRTYSVYCRVCLLFNYLSNERHHVRSLNHRRHRRQRADQRRRRFRRHRHHQRQGGRQASHDGKNIQEEDQVEFIVEEGQSQDDW